MNVCTKPSFQSVQLNISMTENDTGHVCLTLGKPFDFNLYLYSGNFMYFIGYSKWLLLSSRLVAGNTRARHKMTPSACTVSACVCAVRQTGAVSHLRCRRRSWLLHLRFPDSEHSARGTGWDLCSHNGLPTSWPSCRSVTKGGVSFHPSLPALFAEKYQSLQRIL